ncbi:undecaprenyl-phosphate mannosyltransferase [archaeon BMS3Bbin15]|nr:undecaprenyl-phosphate mannosyltransferase [archaeon BMS3Bbin15]
MPAYNEADRVASVVENLRKVLDGLSEEYEILLVDDGSTDSTLKKAIELEKLHNGIVKVLSYDRNMGKGHALKYGFEHSEGEMIFFMDADGDLHPGQIDRFLNVMSRSGADVIAGSKKHPDSKIVNYPISRKVLSTSYFLFTRMLFNLNVRDTQVGIKLFRREVLEDVMPRVLVKEYAFDVELLANAIRRGYRVVEVPVDLTFNNDSRINLKAIWCMFVDTLAIAYRMHILKYYDR